MVVDDENFHDSFPGINICPRGNRSAPAAARRL